MPPLLSHSLTHQGHVRPNNEDCFLSCPEHGLWLVADGMGGHEAGEIASAITRDTILNQCRQGNTLPNAILAAHHEVMRAIEAGEGGSSMGSTVVALQTNADTFTIAWVGDSRAYRWTRTEDGGQLEQLSTDHSYVQMLLNAGSITPAEMETHPEKNVITQCIGSFDNPDIHVDTVEGHWAGNQWLILCSDGLTDELSNQLIAQTLCDSHSTTDAAERLMQSAMDAGGADNITVQVIASPSQATTPPRRSLPGTGNKGLDALLYGLTAACLLALAFYWVG